MSWPGIFVNCKVPWIRCRNKEAPPLVVPDITQGFVRFGIIKDSLTAAAYQPRNPQLSDYYRCVEDYFETFVQVYDEQFSHQYGFWRPYVEQVISRYLDCGDIHNGFAWVKCKDCGVEFLLAFSCKRRHTHLHEDKFLPLLPSEACGGIWGVAVHKRSQKGSSPAFRLRHP